MQIGAGLIGVGMSAQPNPIAAMFPAGKLGVSVEPYLRHTLSQDTAGATPVTAAGDPVGRAFSRFGGGYHPVQAVALAKPLYKIDGDGGAYLEFDASNDKMATPGVPWGSDEATIIAVVRRRSDATANIVRHGYNGGAPGWWVGLSDGARAPLSGARGTTNSLANGPTVASTPAPRMHCIISRIKNGTGLNDLYLGGSLYASATGQGAGAFGSEAIEIGDWFGANYPAMDLYGLVCANWWAPLAVADRAARYMTAMARKVYA